MAGTVRLSDEFFRKAMQTPSVRAALRAKRDAVAAEVEGAALIASDGRELGQIDETEKSEGTRPAGRPYARLAVPVEDDNGRNLGGLKRQVLAEAAGRHSAPRGDRSAR